MGTDETPIPENGEKRRRLKLGDDEEHNNGDSSDGGGEDRLSSLPDVLLVEILSLLPIESAAATSVLSRRWRHLWTHVTRLHFSRYDSKSAMCESFDDCHEIQKIFPTIDHILHQLTSPKIHTFRLDFAYDPLDDQHESFTSSLQSWIHQICCRNVQEIEVLFNMFRIESLIPLPTSVFEIHSLVVLKLFGQFDYKLPPNDIISLPNLKKLALYLGDMNTDGKLLDLLFKSCPLLEDLCLDICWTEDDYFVDISALNLKRLTIKMTDSFVDSRFRIDAPKLEHFDISTVSLSSHCFVRVLNRLLKANIDVEWDAGDVSYNYLDRVLELVRGISSIRTLYLSSFILDSLNDLPDEALPIFYNLTRLTTGLLDPRGWNGLLRFLRCAPNLEVLVVVHDCVVVCDTKSMDWTIPNFVPVCLLNKLKRMEVRKLQGCEKELDFLRYILSYANVLERLLLSDFNSNDGELCKESKYFENLFRFTRSSVACEIEVDL